ncbi:amidase [Phormidesmis sp. 146-12]
MDSVDLAFTSALEQARLIRRKEVSPVDLVETYLQRIQQLNPQLGSYCTMMDDRALQEAKTKTEQLTDLVSDAELPPFFGVPIAIKDLNPVAEVPCSYGVKLIRKRVADRDDWVVTKLKQAGFIILGKTTTSQLGSFPYTEPPGFPPARNPWNLDYTPGGSSGGSAAAVAAGLCAIAQGSDGGGSVRGPAACCGLVGLKPSRGRISNAPVGDHMGGCAVNGTIGRTVADVAAFLDVTAGYVTGDPYWLPTPDASFLSATQQSPGKLRIGYITSISPLGEADPICQSAVQKMAQLLENLGHEVEPIAPDFGDLVDPFTVIWRTQTDVGIPPFFLEKVNRWLWWKARFTPASQYVRSLHKLQKFARQVVALTDTFDILLSPTYMHPTIRVGEWAKLSPLRTLEKIIHWIAPCPAFNVSGQPAISLPGGFDPNGLPIGIQLVGRPADEFTLLSLAAQIEAAQPWISDRPGLAIDSH